jgi:hypothetical protein
VLFPPDRLGQVSQYHKAEKMLGKTVLPVNNFLKKIETRQILPGNET